MTAPVSRRDAETYLPSADEVGELAHVQDFLTAHEAARRDAMVPDYFVTGAKPGDQVQIPEEVHLVLRKVVDAFAHGLAVTVAPQSTILTTQQAADLLGVTRPTVVKMLNEGKLPFERVGSHRRLLLADVLAYRQQRRAAQYAALEATSVQLNDEDDLGTVLRELREARRVTAERRRAATKT